MKYKAAIFDMDGTILDTLEDIKDSLNYSLSINGLPTRDLAEVRQFVGNGLYKTAERAVPSGTSGEVLTKVYEAFVPYYKAHCKNKTKPYEGIIDVIKELRARGILTAVISNKNNNAVGQLCKEMYKDCFDFYLGETEGIKLKPDKEMVDITLSKLNILPSEAIYIGDSDVDLETAKNSSMKCIAVTWGFRDKEFLINNGADYLVDTPNELIKYFE